MIDVPVLVKDALRDGRRLKNYRFKVLNDDGTVDFIIDNNTLVSESVKFDERMCSGDIIKFGLCEGSSLEFQYFDHPNIRGRRVYSEIEVQYEDADKTLKWQTIPMGYFEVDKCPMQFSTGIHKVTAYNKLKAEYLDAKANDLIQQIFADGVAGCTSSIDISIILEMLLNNYSIQSNYLMVSNPGTFVIDGSRDAWVLKNYDTPNKYVIMIKAGVFLQSYPSESYIPEDPVHDYGGKDWYYTGYLRLWAPTKRIYETIMSYNEVTDHLDDRYYKLSNSTDQYDEIVGTLRQALTGASPNTEDGADYYTFSATMKTAAGSVKTAKLSLTPDNLDKEDSYGPIAKGLRGANATMYLQSPVVIWMPTLIKEVTSTVPITRDNVNQFVTSADFNLADQRVADFFLNMSYGVYDLNTENVQIQRRTDPVSGFEIPYANIEKLPDVTLRELQSALFEVACQYGQIDRVTDLFYGKELETEALYPSDILYPDNALYPGGTRESGFKAQYSKLWTETQGVQSFRNLIIKYKTLDSDNKEVDATLTVEVNADGTTDYNMDDNWVFKNLVWTSQQIEDYADAMVAKMQGLKWFPFEMWCAGLPYIETGDEVEIILGQNTFTTYVLQRQLSGIQNLQDTYINGTLEIF